jgi:hypothetical protein
MHRDPTPRETFSLILQENLPPLLVVALYLLFGELLFGRMGAPSLTTLKIEHEAVNVMALVICLFYAAGRTAWLARQAPAEAPLLPYVWDQWRGSYLNLRHVVGFLVVHLSLPHFSVTFGAVKLLIPKLNPFSWDATFFAWDRALHLGVDPWRLLHPILGYPVVTFVMNVLYNLWMIVMMTMIVWQSWSADRRTRVQFLTVMLLIWALPCTVLATAWSSAGPCYYAALVPGEDPYAPLMSYLNTVHTDHYTLWAVEMQGKLWSTYTTGDAHVISGISAMPSGHVAASTLFALTGWRAGRAAGIGLTVFLVIILVGSVHLGWHYAVDGYVGAASALGLWWLVGKLLDRFAPGVRDERSRLTAERGGASAP